MIRSIFGSATRRFAEEGKSRLSGLDVDLASVWRNCMRGFWSIDVNGRWRNLFKFRNGAAHEVHITDTH